MDSAGLIDPDRPSPLSRAGSRRSAAGRFAPALDYSRFELARNQEHRRYDAVVVGSGPNGLAAAVTLAEAGRSVLVLEVEEQAGGGLRTMELTEPGFRHDVCSTIQAMARISPFLKGRRFDLVTPPAALAHPLDSGAVAVVEGSVADTAAGLGEDAAAYGRLIGPLERHVIALVIKAVEIAKAVPRRVAQLAVSIRDARQDFL